MTLKFNPVVKATTDWLSPERIGDKGERRQIMTACITALVNPIVPVNHNYNHQSAQPLRLVPRIHSSSPRYDL